MRQTNACPGNVLDALCGCAGARRRQERPLLISGDLYWGRAGRSNDSQSSGARRHDRAKCVGIDGTVNKHVFEVALVALRQIAGPLTVGTAVPHLMPQEVTDDLLVIARRLRYRHTGDAATVPSAAASELQLQSVSRLLLQ